MHIRKYIIWGNTLKSKHETYSYLIHFITLLNKNFTQKKNAEKKKKKMWKGDFVCVGTVLGFTNYQTTST